MKTRRFLSGKILFIGAFFALVIAGAIISGSDNTLEAAEGDLTAQQVEQVESLIESYLMDNPGIVMEALQKHQQNQKQAEQELQQQALASQKHKIFNDESLPVAGNPEGDVTLVEFFDYNCGYCKKALPDVMTLLEEDPDLRVMFIDMPILSQASQEAARWALAANEQGKYLDYHVALMSNNKPLNEAAYVAIGEELGLDTDKLRQDATENQEIAEQINENLALAQSLNIRGTPAFIIGDQIAPGYVGVDAMRTTIAQERAEQ